MTTSKTTPGFQRRHSFGLGVLVGLIIAGVVGLLLIAPVALAHHTAGTLETSYGNAIVSTLARFNAGGVGANPTTPTNQTLLQARESYTGSCSQCHGTSGNTQGMFGQTSFPPATDLSSQSAKNLSDSQMFYIIKNGLGFTPMPAFADQYSDTEIWNMVNFIRMLQTTTPDQQVRLDIPTPTADQRTTAGLDATTGDAARGAEVFAAFGCAACHQPSPGGLSINPANDSVERAVRSGRPGMPCFSTTALSDPQLADVRAYIATFPPEGFLGGPNDQPGAGAAGGAPPSGATSSASTGSTPCASTTSGASSTGAAASASPSPGVTVSPSPAGTPTP
jgi:mono/diheme cytochrome c family protein